MRRPWTWAAAGLAIVLLAAQAGPEVTRFFRVDACLDAGGAWDHMGAACILPDHAAPTGRSE